MSKEDPNHYNLGYPSYITPVKQIWVIERGDSLSDEHGNLYKVQQVIKPQIANVKPKIVVKKSNELL